MIRKYTYNEQEYSSAWSVRQAIWDKEHKVFGPEPQEGKADFWMALGVTYTEEPDPEPTEEEKAAAELAEAKRLRAAQVAAITVNVDGMLFNGDETSQDRMTRALRVAEITGMESTNWVLANDQVATVTVAQMKQALAKSMLTQGSYWTKPYDNADEEVTEDAAS